MTQAGQLGPELSGRWRARAFGVVIESAFRVPQLQPATDDAEGPATRLVLTTRKEIDAAWPADEATRVLEERVGAGTSSDHTVDVHEVAGYRFGATTYGTAVVSDGGRVVRIAPDGSDPWRWQRLLLGRVLPWTALLLGLELFHASAVEIDDSVLAFIGPSGIGKSSLALQLVMAGARLVTDDVLAVDRDLQGRLRAHPGPVTAGIRLPERARLTPAQLRGLGELPERDAKTWATLPGILSPLPLRAIFFVTRNPRWGDRAVERIPHPDPAVLLGSTFVPTLEAPRRLENLLDICATAINAVPMFAASVQPGRSADALARQVRDSLRAAAH